MAHPFNLPPSLATLRNYLGGEFVAAEVADTGRTLQQARELDVFRGIVNLRTFANIGNTAHRDFFEIRTGAGNELINWR